MDAGVARSTNAPCRSNCPCRNSVHSRLCARSATRRLISNHCRVSDSAAEQDGWRVAIRQVRQFGIELVHVGNPRPSFSSPASDPSRFALDPSCRYPATTRPRGIVAAARGQPADLGARLGPDPRRSRIRSYPSSVPRARRKAAAPPPNPGPASDWRAAPGSRPCSVEIDRPERLSSQVGARYSVGIVHRHVQTARMAERPQGMIGAINAPTRWGAGAARADQHGPPVVPARLREDGCRHRTPLTPAGRTDRHFGRRRLYRPSIRAGCRAGGRSAAMLACTMTRQSAPGASAFPGRPPPRPSASDGSTHWRVAAPPSFARSEYRDRWRCSSSAARTRGESLLCTWMKASSMPPAPDAGSYLPQAAVRVWPEYSTFSISAVSRAMPGGVKNGPRLLIAAIRHFHEHRTQQVLERGCSATQRAYSPARSRSDRGPPPVADQACAGQSSPPAHRPTANRTIGTVAIDDCCNKP